MSHISSSDAATASHHGAHTHHHDEHSSHHHHHHHHSVEDLRNVNRAFLIGIGINLLFTVIEFTAGYVYDSLALVSDAAHNLSDVASLVVSLIGLKLAQRAQSSLYTYGYKKASVVASIVNALLLFYIVGKIVVEAIDRFSTPAPLQGLPIIFTALVGIVINGVSAFLFFKNQQHDINIRGAFLHLLVDALVSVGVVVSGGIIALTGWTLVDPIVSLLIATMILLSTWPLFRISLRLLLDGVPQNVNLHDIQRILHNHPAIAAFHHLHIWALGTQENALTVHLVLRENLSCTLQHPIKRDLKTALRAANIQHCTFEIETPDCLCDDAHCETLNTELPPADAGIHTAHGAS